MIPKSLHTVTALVNVARHEIKSGVSAPAALALAVQILGYSDSPDVHGLTAKAAKILGFSTGV